MWAVYTDRVAVVKLLCREGAADFDAQLVQKYMVNVTLSLTNVEIDPLT